MQGMIILLTVLMLVALHYIQRRDRQKVQAQRASLFDACAPLFSECHLGQQGVGYPRLEGCYRGRRFQLELIYEALTFRKLPVLWLSVTLMEPTRSQGVVDLMVRPQNTEYFSPFWDLPVSFDLPEEAPAHALLRGDDPAALPPWPILQPHLDFFVDEYAKELLVTPRGVRLVRLAAQAERSRYQILRHGHFEQPALSADAVQPLLERLLALHSSLATAAPGTPISAIAA
jgi:hypothetical protein